MGENSLSSLKGQFIIAMPNLLDPNFFKTVTCISEFASEGGLGIIINRPHTFLSGKNIFEELKIKYVPAAISIPVHIGGPVHINELFVLHGPPFEWEGCHMITPSLAMSNTRDILEAIGMGGGPNSFFVSLGCAGWGPGQLETEIKENAWLTCSIVEEIIFDTPIESRWDVTVRKMGIDPISLSEIAGHA